MKPLIEWTPRFYDRISRPYDFLFLLFFPIGDRGRRKVIEGLERGKILDVACGTGSLLEMADAAGLGCLGIDLSKGMIHQAKQKRFSSLHQSRKNSNVTLPGHIPRQFSVRQILPVQGQKG